MRARRLAVVLVLALLTTLDSRPVSARGGVVGRAAREAAEWAARRLGDGAAKAGKGTLAGRAERLAARHGDDVLAGGRHLGFDTPRRLESAGDRGVMAEKNVRDNRRSGDPPLRDPRRLSPPAALGAGAAPALIRHGGLAEHLVAGLGRPAAKALLPLAPRQARRLAILANSGELARIGRTAELLAVVARFGDRAMAFVWDHKGALVITATLAAFLAEPLPFLDGAKNLAGVVARPLAEVSGRVASAAARIIDWRIVAACTALLLARAAFRRLRRLPSQ